MSCCICFQACQFLDTPDKPESVISLFKKHRFSGTQISNLIKRAQNYSCAIPKKLYDYVKGRPNANLQHHFQERLSFLVPMIQGLII